MKREGQTSIQKTENYRNLDINDAPTPNQYKRQNKHEDNLEGNQENSK